MASIMEICGEKEFTCKLRYEIKRVDGFPTSFEYSCKSNKKDYRKAIKGVKLTAKYIKKMEKFGYSVENARFEKENDK